MKQIAVVFFVITGCIRLSAEEEGNDIDRILSEFSQATSKMTSMQADFDYVKKVQLLDYEETSSGQIKLKRPRKFLLDVKKPIAKKTVVNEKEAWIYEPELNQAQHIILKESGSTVKGVSPLEMAFKGDVAALKRDYNIRLVEKQPQGKTPFYIVELAVRSDEVDTPYSRILLKVEDGVWIPVEITTYDLTGETMERYTFSNLKINPMMWDSDFNFKPPRGVDVVNPFE